MCRCAERRGMIVSGVAALRIGDVAQALEASRSVAASVAQDMRDVRTAAAQRLAMARARLARR